MGTYLRVAVLSRPEYIITQPHLLPVSVYSPNSGSFLVPSSINFGRGFGGILGSLYPGGITFGRDRGTLPHG